VYAGTVTVTVANQGSDPTDGTAVTVTDALPAGLSALTNNPGLGAGPVAASGTGWNCTGTTCSRSDVLAAGASYPPVRITVSVASTAAATLTNAPAVSGGGDGTSATASDAIPVAADACPNGWSNEARVLDSGVVNPERADGCTLLDAIWDAEPFASHAAFVAHVDATAAGFELTDAQRAAIHAAADQSGIPAAAEVDNSCAKRIALTFDDGPSAYRPQNLANLRARSVHATFYDTGVRTEANPQMGRFEVAEGHTVYSHTYDHPHLNALSPALQVAELQKAESAFAAAGVALTGKVLRPPFFEANAATIANLSTTLGYMLTTQRIETTDYEPTNTAAQSRDAILSQLRPGAIILLHDGPIDTPAGQASTDAAAMIIDAARAQGYCFGVQDRAGNVVADRYVPSANPIPQIQNPVPYVPLVRPGTPPSPWVTVPQPLRLAATHAPDVFVRGQTGTITLTVGNVSDDPTDGSTITLRDQLPSGLTPTAASGTGWTCTGTNTRTCTRSDVLAPHSSYPALTIAVNVSATAGFRLTNAPSVTGHGGNVWVDNATDGISVGVPASGDVSGTVPATLSLGLGPSPSFGAFTPGADREYTALTTANVISTAGDAALSVSDPGHLTNGAFALPDALRVEIAPAMWTGPVSNATSAITFRQHIGATDALRTGSYSKTLTFTLSTTNP
jgi:uncharacterized repeat protein (TIGR01451 family)